MSYRFIFLLSPTLLLDHFWYSLLPSPTLPPHYRISTLHWGSGAKTCTWKQKKSDSYSDGLLLGSNYAAVSPCVFSFLLTAAFEHLYLFSLLSFPILLLILCISLHLLVCSVSTLYNLYSSLLLGFHPSPSLPPPPLKPPTHHSVVQRVQKCAAVDERVFIWANETRWCRLIIGGRSFERARQTPWGFQLICSWPFIVVHSLSANRLICA